MDAIEELASCRIASVVECDILNKVIKLTQVNHILWKKIGSYPKQIEILVVDDTNVSRALICNSLTELGSGLIKATI